MKQAWSWITGFAMFWYHFIVGDDWTVAAVVAIGLIATAALLRLTSLPAWWLMPVLVIAVLGVSVRRMAMPSPR